MRRITRTSICAVLLASMLVPSLASCADRSDKEDKETQNSAVSTEASADVPQFEDRDFDEAEFKFLIYGSTATDFTDDYIWSDGVSGGAISDAVMERNRLVEEKYNIKITAEEINGPMGEAVKRMQAGQCDYQVIYEWGIRSKGAALEGMLYDFNMIGNIDLDQSYWIPSATDDLTISDRLFIYTNYITMNSFAWANFLFFNVDMVDELQMQYPYEYVKSNTWTYDAFLPMMLDAEADLNGDSKMSVEDRFGIFGGEDGVMENLVRWSGQQSTVKDSDGMYQLSINTERAQTIYDTYKKKLSTADTYLEADEIWNSGADMSSFPSKYVAARYLSFGEGHTLFLDGTMDMTKEFVNMENEYGVVPNPKYTESQSEYYHWVDVCAPMFSIPVQATDDEIDMIGIVLEYMAYESEQNLLPAFYETTVKTKRMEKTDNYEMLDIIRSSVHYDWVSLYLFDGTTKNILSEMLSSGNFASVYRRYQTKAEAEIADLLDEIDDISQ